MKNPLQSDNEIMALVQNGDVRKVGLLYERYKKDLFQYFYRMTNDGQKSEDLVQNTFMKVIRFNDKFQQNNQFNYWLFSIARNVWIDAYNKKDILKHASTEEALYAHSDAAPNPDTEMVTKEKHQMLHIALNRLTPNKKEAIVLSRFQGMKYKDIAQLMNTTETNIKTRVRRGLEDLKIIMQQLEMQ